MDLAPDREALFAGRVEFTGKAAVSSRRLFAATTQNQPLGLYRFFRPGAIRTIEAGSCNSDWPGQSRSPVEDFTIGILGTIVPSPDIKGYFGTSPAFLVNGRSGLCCLDAAGRLRR